MPTKERWLQKITSATERREVEAVQGRTRCKGIWKQAKYFNSPRFTPNTVDYLNYDTAYSLAFPIVHIYSIALRVPFKSPIEVVVDDGGKTQEKEISLKEIRETRKSK